MGESCSSGTGDAAIGVVSIAPCNAPAPLQNSAVGWCTAHLPYESSFKVECDQGFDSAWLTKCSADGYLPVSCVCSPEAAARCDAMNNMEML